MEDKPVGNGTATISAICVATFYTYTEYTRRRHERCTFKYKCWPNREVSTADSSFQSRVFLPLDKFWFGAPSNLVNGTASQRQKAGPRKGIEVVGSCVVLVARRCKDMNILIENDEVRKYLFSSVRQEQRWNIKDRYSLFVLGKVLILFYEYISSQIKFLNQHLFQKLETA
jgi:hypothetical protein